MTQTIVRDSAKAAIRALYDDLGPAGMKNWLTEYKLGDEAAYAKTLVAPDELVLDLACGYGRIAIPLSEHGANVFGLDLSPVLIKAAREESDEKKLNADFMIGDMCTLPYPEAFFHKVLCFWNSFCHVVSLKDQIACLNEVHRVLKPGGTAIFLFSDPTQNSWSEKLAKSNNRVVDMDIVSGHNVPIYIHDFDTVRDLVSSTNFSKHEVGLQQIELRSWMKLTLFKN